MHKFVLWSRGLGRISVGLRILDKTRTYYFVVPENIISRVLARKLYHSGSKVTHVGYEGENGYWSSTDGHVLQ